MLEQHDPYIVYIKADDRNRIAAINSSAFLTDTSGWTEIDNGFGDKFYHAQGNYFNDTIMDDRGIYRYKLADGKPVERTQEEMDADWVEPTPVPVQTPEQRIAALEEQLSAYETAYAEGVNEA